MRFKLALAQYPHWDHPNHQASNGTEWEAAEPKAYRVEPANIDGDSTSTPANTRSFVQLRTIGEMMSDLDFPVAGDGWTINNHKAMNGTEWEAAEPKAYKVDGSTTNQAPIRTLSRALPFRSLSQVNRQSEYPHWDYPNHQASNETEWVAAEPKAYRTDYGVHRPQTIRG